MREPALATNDIEQLRQLALEAWRRADQLQVEADQLAREKAELEQAKAEADAKRTALEREVDVLLARIAKLTEQLAKATNKDVQLQLALQLKTLRNELSNHAKETFGSRSERRGRPEGAKGKRKAKKKTGHGPTPQPDLPIEVCTCRMDEPDLVCPKCGANLRVMANQFEESELIVAVERKYVLQQVQQQKYNCGGCGHIDTAPGPLKPIRGGRYGLSFAVDVAVSKYVDSLPLERQVVRMGRQGLRVTSQTLWDQVEGLYGLLLPTLVALQSRVREAPLLHVDETTWRQMGRKKSDKWWLWVVVSEHGVCFDLLPTRGNAAACQVLWGYGGIVMADGYAVYTSLERAFERQGGQQMSLDGDDLPLPNFLLVCCWMHARRPFFKAAKHTPEAEEALDLIAKLYAVEDEADQLAAADPDARLEHRRRLRADKSAAILAELDLWRRTQRALPRTQFAKGLTFLDRHWPALTRFVEDPRIPMDNGEAERQIRVPVVGRKNYYGTRSELGARVAAAMFSLLGTCKLLGVNPRDYLTEAATRAIRDPGSVYLPHDHLAELASPED